MLMHPTLDQLRTLRLDGMVKAFEEQLQMQDIGNRSRISCSEAQAEKIANRIWPALGLIAFAAAETAVRSRRAFSRRSWRISSPQYKFIY